MQRAATIVVALFALIGAARSVAAQDGGGFSIGPRLTFVRGTQSGPEGTQRFSGGVIRLSGGKAALELAMDYRSGLTGELTERIRDYPIQASLLLFPFRTRLAPYLLGGVGWYSQRVTRFSAPTGTTVIEDETTRTRGYHAGFGAELRLHRRFGLYGDYRYTMISFGGDPESDDIVPSPIPGWIPGAERLRLAHEGSMFTWGATFHF